MDAQKDHPNSALYLFFAGRMARNALDLPLSTQSFMYAAEISRGEWAEVAVTSSCRFEMAINHMITGNWNHAAATFDYLCEQQYWSAAFCRYAQGACYEMMGERTEAVLIFAEVPDLVVKKLGGRLSDIDSYVLRKVTMFQKSGYQNLDFFAPILEYMCIWNLFPFVSHKLLKIALKRVQLGLTNIQKCEQLEQEHELQLANINFWEQELELEKNNLETQLNEISTFESTWTKMLQTNIKGDFSYGGVQQ